ncbi:MAG: AAA family ATPase [Thermomicrobia bacterium]|nr:AAA family ATPase [Thermomicrobia bacterium]
MTDNLEDLLSVLPPHIEAALTELGNRDALLEIVMDLGRRPEARYEGDEITLGDAEVTRADLAYVAERIGQFGGDNRAGIERTLHRISAIRNRKGEIVGLTCRIGRAVYGTIAILRDLVESGESILMLGRPGVGKTTMLREAARVLADELRKRVVIVDTSNEIAGDGDIPHPSIGRARRMQVPTPTAQHGVMIEAVENHMPEVIVIDEIGTELEAGAARTIAERGVQLIGTAHGNTLENLMLNPTLADLVGGIQSVTLSDEEARRRGTQKSILERKAPPTFEVVVEIQDRDHLNVHHDVAKAVDMMLRERQMPPELRYRDGAQIKIEQVPAKSTARPRAERDRADRDHGEPTLQLPSVEAAAHAPSTAAPHRTLRAYPYGVSQSRLQQVARSLQVPVHVVNELDQADVVLTLKNYYRKRPQRIGEAERRGVPIYVLRSNSPAQMESCLADIFGIEREVERDPFDDAQDETRLAIEDIRSGRRTSVDLLPQNAFVRRKQHEMAREASLLSRSHGKEPRRSVRIYQNNG